MTVFLCLFFRQIFEIKHLHIDFTLEQRYTSLGGIPNCLLKLREKFANDEAPTL